MYKFQKKKGLFFCVLLILLVITIHKQSVQALEVLVNGNFSTETDSASLRSDDSGQDWYESRADSAPNGPNQLTLDETNIAGNATKKAKFTGGSTYNTYMSQALPSALNSGTFTVQWDIYVDSIVNVSATDRSGWMFLGNDSNAIQGPSSTDVERWAILAWAKVGGGDTGAVSLTYRDRDDALTAFSLASSTLALDTWYTIKLVGNPTTDTYDIYVNDMLQVSGATSRYANVDPSYISFASWNDGAGTFYIDNVTLDDGTTLDPTFTQNRYRWYANTDAISPTDPWPVGGTNLAENTSIGGSNRPSADDVLRLRMSVQNSVAELTANAQDFKLQFGTGSSCASVSNWQDVGEISSSTAPWRGYNNTSAADNATISSLLLTGADIGGSYEEENSSALNPNTVAVGEDVEYDWVLQAHNLADETNYCFRMVESDGTIFNTYTNYPQVTNSATVFDVSFEGGNGENFVRVGDAVSFAGELDIGTGTYLRTTWFYFSMTNVLNKTIAFTMTNARGANTETNVWTGKRPFYSYDQITWYPVTNDGTDNNPSFTWNAPGNSETFTQDTVYIAYAPPYTYTHALNDIDRWEDSEFASSTEIIGQSVQGRNIHLLTFEDVNSPIPYANKKVMWVDSRQHPMEMGASYAAQAIVDFYLDTTNPEAKVFRQGWILKIIPDVNPDAMYLGQTRSNANGWDLNREWNNGAPNIGTEEIEVYEVHSAIHDWVTTQGNSIDIFLDMHTQSSAPPSAFYANTSFSHEIMEDNLGFLLNFPFNAFSAGSYAIDVVYDNYGAPAYTIEGPDVRWDADNHPTIANNRAWGRAWAMAAISEFETNADIFTFHEITEGSGASDNLLVTAPGKFRTVFDEAKGGAMTYWYDTENQSDHTAQLGDLTNGVDRLIFNDGTARNLSASTNVATSSTYLAGPVISKITYTGDFGGVANYDYTLTKTIWQDGRIWNNFTLVNNTGSSVDWTTMGLYNSLTNTNFDLAYDNFDNTPNEGEANWFAQIGNGTGGIKAALVSYFVSQTGNWYYDHWGFASGPPQTSYYYDSNGPIQTNGSTITINWVQQINPDNDVLTNETDIDVYSYDIMNPDTPTVTKGNFNKFSPTDGGLEFEPNNNQIVFTYANADTYTKKKPSFILTNYTASTAPVLKVNGSFLDSETGSAHSGDTYLGTAYNSYVDDANNIAYIQYLSDVSSNVQIQMGNALANSAPAAPSAVTAVYNSDTQITVTWTDNSADEDGFIIQRRDDTGSGWSEYTEICTIPANSTNFLDNSANNPDNPPAANERYQYKIIAQNIIGNSTGATSSAIDTKPAAPTIGTATVDSSTAITWTWTDNAKFEDSYRIDYESSAGTDVDDLAANATSYQATGLTPNTAYSVSVRAYHNTRGESSASATSDEVYTLANIPNTLSASVTNMNNITVAWNANSNPNGTEYYVENVTLASNSGWITSANWYSNGLTCNTEYTFRVKARNGDSIDTTWSDNFTASSTDCTLTNGGGGAVSLPAAIGEGRISETISMGQIADIGAVQNSGTNVLAYINSGASFQATVSNHNNKTTQEHSFKILDLDLLNNIITIQINSKPQIIKLKLNETQKVDLDGDGVKDLEIKFADIYINRAEITMATVLDEQILHTLIKYANSPKVYLLENNKKRWITDGETFLALGYKWSDIQIIPEITTYTDGENLTTSQNKYILKNFLKLGQTSEEVRQLQTKLKTLGYFHYPSITGYFGQVTEQAVKAFQKANNISPLGYVGPATRAALNK